MSLSHNSEISLKRNEKLAVYKGWYENANRDLIREAAKNSNVSIGKRPIKAYSHNK